MYLDRLNYGQEYLMSQSKQKLFEDKCYTAIITKEKKEKKTKVKASKVKKGSKRESFETKVKEKIR